ncbi:hypothetical protein Tco_0373760 [Tanacetum coccineum]
MWPYGITYNVPNKYNYNKIKSSKVLPLLKLYLSSSGLETCTPAWICCVFTCSGTIVIAICVLYLAQHAILRYLESLLTISRDNLCLDNLDIFKEDLEYQSCGIIMEYLVNISKRRVSELKMKLLCKINILIIIRRTPSRKIDVTGIVLHHQRPQRKEDQYAYRRSQYAVLKDIVCEFSGDIISGLLLPETLYAVSIPWTAYRTTFPTIEK